MSTGLMHADTHGGNLLRVNRRRFLPPELARLIPWKQRPAIGYVDFGLVSRVPVNVSMRFRILMM